MAIRSDPLVALKRRSMKRVCRVKGKRPFGVPRRNIGRSEVKAIAALAIEGLARRVRANDAEVAGTRRRGNGSPGDDP